MRTSRTGLKLDTTFNKQCIDEHNRLRKLHGCPPLFMDRNLAKGAQKYAESLVAKNEMKHDTARDFGENLAYFYNEAELHMLPKAASDMWYNEGKNYSYCSEAPEFGHFTQLVWKETRYAGFGLAMDPSKENVYIVGRYKPKGNISGQYEVNVPHPVDSHDNDEAQVSSSEMEFLNLGNKST
ncbi:unnamed protein product [Calicophoron daubneyi]|uniref:SCP domain-containing protein n=1 Tax=Calicophoron daubneyi TaxID=300641 RepID=A0AAV2TEM9_CALDB